MGFMETHRIYEKGHEFNLIYLFTKLSAKIIFYNQVLKARNNHIMKQEIMIKYIFKMLLHKSNQISDLKLL